MDQISYDVCEACGSFWLDASELMKMAYKVNGNIEYCSREKAKGVQESTKNCPRCEDMPLDKVFFLGESDILLDHCKNCMGFWLDGGELDLINKELKEIMHVRGKGFSKFVNNIHLPFWYKKIRRKSSETDFEMEVLPIKDAEFKSNTTYKCPACHTALNLYTVYKIEIEGCPKCKGIWLDNDELRILKDKSEKGSWGTLRWLDDEVEAIEETKAITSKRICPICKEVNLYSTIFGGSNVVIDWCPSCHGTWLDRDEFQEIMDFLKSKLDKLSSDDLAKKVYDEIKEIRNGPEGKISELLDAKAAIWTLINVKYLEIYFRKIKSV
jgi:Zn-finger nucleic acid-binding protein